MRWRLSRLLVIPALALGLASCGGSSTDPIDAPQIFEGELAFMGTAFHTLTVANSGFLRVEIPRLQEKVAPDAQPLGLDLTLGLGVGRPAEDQCATRYSVRVTEGAVVVLSLSNDDFCLSLFDVGFLTPDLIVEYTVSVTPE